MVNFIKKFFGRSKSVSPAAPSRKQSFTEIGKIINSIPKNAHIGIFSHRGADYDSIYSSLAFLSALEQMGFSNAKAYIDENEKELLEPAGAIMNLKNVSHNPEPHVDVAIIVDLARASVLGKYEKYAMAAKTILIFDHHQDPLIKNTAMLVDNEAAAAGEVLYDFFKSMNITFTKELAALLHVAIMGDSQNLTTTNTRENTVEAVRSLIATGFDMQAVRNCLQVRLSPPEIKALSKALNTMKQTGIVTVFAFDGRKKEKIPGVDYDKIRGKCMSVLGMGFEKILLTITVFDNEVRGSLRSSCEKDVNELAAKLGGGGHKKAAGFTTDLPDNYAISIVTEYFKK